MSEKHQRAAAVLLDVDGTLLDSNGAHARAWSDVFAEFGHDVPVSRARELIGMGGDNLMPAAIGIEKDSREGKRIAKRRAEYFKERFASQLRPFPRVRELVARFRADGYTIVVATSAQKEELKNLLEKAGVADLIDESTSASDAKRSKPDPDIIEAAVENAGTTPDACIMLGDTPYDVEAASRAGVPTVALRCGGWDDAALKGAIEIYDDPANLLTRYETSVFGRRAVVADRP